MTITTLILLCFKIFFCRILDVTLGTVRQVLTIKEQPVVASLIGFCEVTIWYLVVREAINSDASIYTALSYAAGFATGTFLGGIIAKRFVKVKICTQVVTSERDNSIVETIQTAGFGVSVVNVNGSKFAEEKYLLIIETNGSRLKELKALINRLDEKAFIFVQESKHVVNGFIK